MLAWFPAVPRLPPHLPPSLSVMALQERAYQEVEALENLGYRPGPQHYNSLIKAEAALGKHKGGAG